MALLRGIYLSFMNEIFEEEIIIKTHAKAIVLLITILTISLLITGCSAKDKLTGKWVNDLGSSIEFMKDGTFSEFSMFPLNGNYSIPENGKLKLEFTGLMSVMGSLIYDYEIEGNTLTMKDAMGNVSTYNKEK